MEWKKINKDLLKFLEDAVPRINEEMSYGIPHVVGEIKLSRNDARIELSLVTFNGGRHPLVFRDEDTIGFMYPVEDSNPYAVFLEVLNFIGKTLGDRSFGMAIRTPPVELLEGLGFNVLWVNEYALGGLEFVQVWAVSRKTRYNILFEKREKVFVLRDIKRIDA